MMSFEFRVAATAELPPLALAGLCFLAPSELCPVPCAPASCAPCPVGPSPLCSSSSSFESSILDVHYGAEALLVWSRRLQGGPLIGRWQLYLHESLVLFVDQLSLGVVPSHQEGQLAARQAIQLGALLDSCLNRLVLGSNACGFCAPGSDIDQLVRRLFVFHWPKIQLAANPLTVNSDFNHFRHFRSESVSSGAHVKALLALSDVRYRERAIWQD